MSADDQVVCTDQVAAVGRYRDLLHTWTGAGGRRSVSGVRVRGAPAWAGLTGGPVQVPVSDGSVCAACGRLVRERAEPGRRHLPAVARQGQLGVTGSPRVTVRDERGRLTLTGALPWASRCPRATAPPTHRRRLRGVGDPEHRSQVTGHRSGRPPQHRFETRPTHRLTEVDAGDALGAVVQRSPVS